MNNKNKPIYTDTLKHGGPLPTVGDCFLIPDSDIVVMAIEVPCGQFLKGWWLGSLDRKCSGGGPRTVKEFEKTANVANQEHACSYDSMVLVSIHDPRARTQWSALVRDRLKQNERARKYAVVCEGDHPIDLE